MYEFAELNETDLGTIVGGADPTQQTRPVPDVWSTPTVPRTPAS